MAMARLGSGPFQIVDFWPPDHTEVGGETRKWEADVDVGRCACCGAKVSWRVVIRNTVDDTHHVVGRDCAKKAVAHIGTTADQLKAELRRVEKAYKRRQEDAKWQAEEDAKYAREVEAARHRTVEKIEREAQVAFRYMHCPNIEVCRLIWAAYLAAFFEAEWDAPLFPELGFITDIRTALWNADITFAME